jgi:uncharacterized protein
LSSHEYSIFKPVKPYFDLVRGALGDLVEGAHFFGCASDDIVYEVLYEFPGWPRVIEGKADLMESFQDYGKHIVIHSADHLTKHTADDGKVIVIEYEVHGTILSTGVRYNNRFCSIIQDHKQADCSLEGLHGLPRRLERAYIGRSVTRHCLLKRRAQPCTTSQPGCTAATYLPHRCPTRLREFQRYRPGASGRQLPVGVRWSVGLRSFRPAGVGAREAGATGGSAQVGEP